MGDIMRKGHIFITILQFVFIILFISCKNKNDEVITVENTAAVSHNSVRYVYLAKSLYHIFQLFANPV